MVFTEPDEKYCRTAEHGDVSAVFTKGRHEWLQGWYNTEELDETNDESMGEDHWLMVYERVLVVWPGQLRGDWLVVGEATAMETR